MESWRDPVDEREEIDRHIEESAPERPLPSFNEDIGRFPTAPARGWRLRAKKAKSCDLCEGDLWVEAENGDVVPCKCREKRAVKRAHHRLRAGHWWRGTSLSFGAPPLMFVPVEIQRALEKLCGDIKNGNAVGDHWVIGGPGTGKSALSAYMAQRLYPTNDAIVEQVGDLLGHLRWLGAIKGENAVERRVQKLIDTPLLVLDNVDRAVKSRPSKAPFGLEASCVSHDLIRFSRLLKERHASGKPMVMTSRADPADCPARLASVTRRDLVQGLLGTAIGRSDPFEDFPDYTEAILNGSMEGYCREATVLSLDSTQEIAQAA